MLALDLDGTILSSDGTVSQRTLDAVRAASAAGYRICVATGRNYTESRFAIERLSIRGECIFVGGAIVIDTATGRTLHRTAMDSAIAAEVCALFESLGHAALALQDTFESGLDYLITKSIPIRLATRAWMDAMEMGIEYVPSLGSHLHRHTLRVGVCCETPEADAVMEQLQRHFGNRTMMHRLRVPGAQCEVVEVFDPAVSKWEGINFIIGRNHIAPHQVIAVGDDMNDLQMIQHSGLGVAMGNARPALKQAADLVIGENSENGLAVFLEELLSGKYEAAA